MTKGACPMGTGLSPTVEPVPVSPPDGASIPSAGSQLCEFGLQPNGWQPIATVPMKETVLLGSHYDCFVLRHPFEPIWQTTEGHAFEWRGGVEFSLRGRLDLPPTHWRPLLEPPPYEPSAEQREIAQEIEARRAETQGGSVHESAVGNADAPNPAPNPRGSTQEREG